MNRDRTRNAEGGTRNGADRLRALNAPHRVAVELDACGLPSRTGVVPIEAVRETWRIDDEWWRKEVSRMYYQVMLEGGQVVTLFRDLMTDDWYVQNSATPHD